MITWHVRYDLEMSLIILIYSILNENLQKIYGLYDELFIFSSYGCSYISPMNV